MTRSAALIDLHFELRSYDGSEAVLEQRQAYEQRHCTPTRSRVSSFGDRERFLVAIALDHRLDHLDLTRKEVERNHFLRKARIVCHEPLAHEIDQVLRVVGFERRDSRLRLLAYPSEPPVALAQCLGLLHECYGPRTRGVVHACEDCRPCTARGE